MTHWPSWKPGLVAATLAACLVGPALAGTPVLSALGPLNPVLVGQAAFLQVQIDNVADLYAYQFSLSFDPALLQATTVTEGDLLPSGGTTIFVDGNIDNTAGTISFVLGSLIGTLPGVNGSGTLATIGFNAVGVGTSALTFSNVLLLDSNLTDIVTQAQNGVLVTTNVPEPASWLLFGLGLAGMAGVARRRSTASA